MAPRRPRGEWSYEIKFDGYRLMARPRNGTTDADHPRGPRLDYRLEGL